MRLRLNPFSRRRPRAEPFLVFALARSGSTTLRRLLESHPAISCIHEPFNPDRRGSKGPVADGAMLRRELRQLRERYTGIKHVWDAEGWPFPKGSPLNQELLQQPGQRILFLNRRNTLRRLVSHQIALQANAWGTGEEDRTAVREFPFAPLDTGVLEHFLAIDRSAIARSRAVIVESGNPFLDLWYEELFDPKLPFEAKEEMLAGIFRFLGLDPTLPALRRERVGLLFEPEGGPLNSTDTYRRVPGIADVEARFGSDSTGHLFR